MCRVALAALVLCLTSCSKTEQADETAGSVLTKMDADTATQQAELLAASHTVIRSLLKYECSFTDGDKAVPGGYASGFVLVSNQYGAKQRVKWILFLTDDFGKLTAEQQSKSLKAFEHNWREHVDTLCIGGWTIREDGEHVDKGEI